VTGPPDTVEIASRPATTGSPAADLADLYLPVRDAVTGYAGTPVVLAGDCVAALGVIAGIQQRRIHPSLVWFDAHGDFLTEDTTSTGYFGGLPLAKILGRGDLTLPSRLGLTTLAEESVILSDGRDLDPEEAEALDASRVNRLPVTALNPANLPGGPVVLHVDLDVIDPEELAGLRYPARNGPSLAEVAAAIRAVVEARPVAAVSIAATWKPEQTNRAQTDLALRTVLVAAGISLGRDDAVAVAPRQRPQAPEPPR
jgi:arginase